LEFNTNWSKISHKWQKIFRLEFLDCCIEQVTVEQATVKQVTAEQDKQIIVNKLNENIEELKKQRGRPAVNKKALIFDANTTKQSTKKRVIAIASRKSERLAKK
jgi:hypothetical protein